MPSEVKGSGDKSSVSSAFFGRRKSKSLSKAQQARIETLYPKLRIGPGSAVKDLSAAFVDKPDQIVLEIGFGGGEHLIHQAITHPQNGYIGVEPFVNSMAKALREIDVRRVSNIRLYDDDAVSLLDWMPSASIDRIDLLYPDPWPKKRHWKRRFVNAANLDRFARILKSGGGFHFASDIDSYVNWTLNKIWNHPDFKWTAHDASDWKKPFGDWVTTRYEAKAHQAGRVSSYLRFQRI